MRILLTGKQGQVGWELCRTLAPLGQVSALGREQLDLADADSIRRAVRELRPQLIVNPAAYTAVDLAESDAETATAVNGAAPGILAEEAKRLGAGLIHYSTDYVFDGGQDGVYRETDATNPGNVYGRSKLAGEQAIQAVGAEHLILRTSWVYGLRGRNFLLTMLRLAREREELRVVADQIGAPTWSRMIAEATALAAARWYMGSRPQAGLSGVYHLTAGGSTSWHGFVEAIVRLAGEQETLAVQRITPIATADYPTPARRPANSRLDGGKLEQAFGLRLPDWQDSLAACLDAL
jgi:dTDP-4-dehydrorhamnose reductase